MGHGVVRSAVVVSGVAGTGVVGSSVVGSDFAGSCTIGGSVVGSGLVERGVVVGGLVGHICVRAEYSTGCGHMRGRHVIAALHALVTCKWIHVCLVHRFGVVNVIRYKFDEGV